MSDAGMRLRCREDDADSVFSGSKGIEGPVAGGIGRDPTNVRDGGCLDVRRRCRSSVEGEEMLGNGVGDFASPEGKFDILPFSRWWFTLGKLDAGDLP